MSEAVSKLCYVSFCKRKCAFYSIGCALDVWKIDEILLQSKKHDKNMSGGAKRKHQITYLAAQAKAQQTELEQRYVPTVVIVWWYRYHLYALCLNGFQIFYT